MRLGGGILDIAIAVRDMWGEGKEKSPPPDAWEAGLRLSGTELFRGREICLGLRPVHDVPPRFHVVRTAILVVQVIGVLPHIEAQNGRATATGRFPHQGIILVGGRANGELAVFHAQPRPAGTEPAGCRRGELFLKSFEAAEILRDRFSKFADWLALGVRLHELPEKAVVPVAAAVVADRAADGFRHGGNAFAKFLNALAREIRSGFERLVQIGNVRGVVLAVVDLHGLRVDVGFESVRSVRQCR
jgi:hypothetical protein